MVPVRWAAYRKGLGISEVLAARDPGNSVWQRDLSISYENVGGMLEAEGDGAGALAAYRKGQGIREVLAARDPGNSEWQRDLSISYERVGGMLAAEGAGAGALAAYRKDLASTETLAARDPANAEWQRDLIVSLLILNKFTGERPYAARALDIALSMQRRGTLAPGDVWLVEDLKQRANK